jgi:hypothetical protein
MTKQEFWEWCGFKQEAHEGYKTWNYPEGFDAGLAGAYRKYEFYMPELTLDNIRKYAIPPLLQEHTIEITIMETKTRVCIYFDFDDNKNMVIVSDPDTTQALYKAICEVIDGI